MFSIHQNGETIISKYSTYYLKIPEHRHQLRAKPFLAFDFNCIVYYFLLNITVIKDLTS